MWSGGSAQGHRRAPSSRRSYPLCRTQVSEAWPDLARGIQSQGRGWPSPEGREGKEEAAAGSSEGLPESVRTALWIEIGGGSLRERGGSELPSTEWGGGPRRAQGSPAGLPNV